jgi:Asp-tRNA(Asn)/Glu-tRNA(Gln) amidotransferase A subunit family amidase
MVPAMTHEKELSRRDLLKRGAIAGVGAYMNLQAASGRVEKGPSVLSGLAVEYAKYDGLGLAALIAKKQISPLELLDAVCQRVHALNPRLNAFCHLFFDKAEAQIAHSLGAGPFRGVPFALKDLNMYMTGTITSAGSRVYKNNVSGFDSTLVERYKKAGLVIFAKTNSPELGLATTTESILFGQTHNPWKLERTPGGSSGGTAAAVAARIVPMAHGSDSGGSIRIPASCCGLFGFKPTRGRVPFGPSQFEGWNGCGHQHALTVSVRDSAALLDVSAGPELGSPHFSPTPSRPFLQEVGSAPGRLRIALAVPTPGGTPLDPECQKAALDAAKLCESLGHHVEEAVPPIDNALFPGPLPTIAGVSVARVLDDAAAVLGRPVTDEDVEPITWAIMEEGLKTTSVAYSRAIATMHQIGLAIARFQERYDVILNPTLAKPPVALGLLSQSQQNFSTWVKEVIEFSPYTALYDITGQPSMSVPLYWTPDGLPVGTMFSARFGEDAMLFRLASQLEQARGWKERIPPILAI